MEQLYSIVVNCVSRHPAWLWHHSALEQYRAKHHQGSRRSPACAHIREAAGDHNAASLVLPAHAWSGHL